MQPEIFTTKDALRRSAKRVAIAVCAAVVLNLALLGAVFGTDPDTNVRLGLLAIHCVASGAIIAGLLAGVMTYRTSLLMQTSRARAWSCCASRIPISLPDCSIAEAMTKRR